MKKIETKRKYLLSHYYYRQRTYQGYNILFEIKLQLISSLSSCLYY